MIINGDITSPRDRGYNCIAWAADDNIRWWEPGPNPFRLKHWPKGIANDYFLESYIEAYKTVGYNVCDVETFEHGFIKVALYVLNNVTKHAARQINESFWTSKLGQSYDIKHEFIQKWDKVLCHPLGVFDLSDYGEIGVILKKPLE